jgi:hypothetical protein
MRGAARLSTAIALVVTPLLGGFAPAAPWPGTATAPYGIPLPQTFRNIDPVHCLAIPGVRKDRCRTSKVPSTVDDTEALTVGVGPGGAPAVVTNRQHLVVHGSGPYLIYELGPARAVEGLNDLSLPTAELGQVVWQGFSPGVRALDGLLTLDPGFEAARLPMSIRIRFADRHRKPMALQPGGRAPADGTATITLVNLSPTKRFLSVGTAAAAPLARALDTLLAAARSDRPGVPPYAGNGLPARLPGTLAGQTDTLVTAPLRVRGTITVPAATGAPVTGPGTTPVPGGASISGTLEGDAATFQAELRAGQRLALSLDVQPWLDPRTIGPPGGARSWAAWAATHPAASAVGDATATLMAAAAQAARAADYSPYLQTDTRGQAVSSFHYEIASAAAARRAGAAVSAKPGAIVAACLAGLAIAGNAALLRRQL